MSNLTIGKRDVTKLATALEAGEFTGPEDMAKAALELAFEIYEAKSAWMIVGQLRYQPGQGFLRATDAHGEKVALGPYGTEKQAITAGESLAYSNQTGEEFRWWVLPIHRGTPAAWFKARKLARQEAELAAKERKMVPTAIEPAA